MADETLKREENHKTVGAGVSTVDESILMFRVDPITNYGLASVMVDSIVATPASMVKRDQNFRPTVYGISSVDGITLVPIRTDEDGYLLAQF